MLSSNLFLLVLLAMLWGPSFLFIKVAVAEIPPFSMVTVRVGLAAILLFSFLKIQKKHLPKWGRMWRHFAILALFAHALPFVLFSWGEIHIDSALASILNGTTPLFTLLIAHFATTDERMTFSKISGSTIGFLGLLLLLYPELRGGLDATALGVIAVAIAAASYAVAIVYARRNVRGLPPLVAPTAQLTVATLYMIPLALIFERPFAIAPPSWHAVGSMFALAILGTAIAFVVYYRIIEHAGATYLSMVTYLVPVFGVALGVIVLNERLAWNAYLGCTLIILGVMVVNGVLRIPERILKLVNA